MFNFTEERKDFRKRYRPMPSHATRDVRDFILTYRGSGSTTFLMNSYVRANGPIALLVASYQYGSRLLKKHNLTERDVILIAFENLDRGLDKLRGIQNAPLYIDNSFLSKFVEITDGDIGSLWADNEDIRKEIGEIEKELEKSKNYRYIKSLEEDLHHSQYRTNVLHQTNITLGEQIRMVRRMADLKGKEINDAPYFYVPLTMFLCFYFFMATYILFALLCQ